MFSSCLWEAENLFSWLSQILSHTDTTLIIARSQYLIAKTDVIVASYRNKREIKAPTGSSYSTVFQMLKRTLHMHTQSSRSTLLSESLVSAAGFSFASLSLYPSLALFTLGLLCSPSEAVPLFSTNEQTESSPTQISHQLRSSRNSLGIWGNETQDRSAVRGEVAVTSKLQPWERHRGSREVA